MHSSPAIKLPQDVVEIIISYLIYDTPSLMACSLTCHSWYIAAVPHLHHTLTTDNRVSPDTKHSWPRPLKRSHKLGLLPFVKQFRIRLHDYGHQPFTLARLDRRTLQYFSALTNLQDLGIDYLDVPSFMPTIQQCFGHFSPTLQFLALKSPRGSCRQILYFIGFFPNLQDLKINYLPLTDEENIADVALVPLSTPPLRGRLTIAYFKIENLVKGMIALFGGLRFRHMDLFDVDCTQLLLGACAGTLETLRLYPTDRYGEEHFEGRRGRAQLRKFITDDSTLLQKFDLSRNRSLRTLETTATSIHFADELRGVSAFHFFKTVLSSITPSVPLDFAIIYWEPDLGHCPDCYLRKRPSCFYHMFPSIVDRDQQVRVIQELHSVRDFRLVLRADCLDHTVDHCVRVLESIVGAVEEGRGRLPHEPLIIPERRLHRIRKPSGQLDRSSGMGLAGDASAL